MAGGRVAVVLIGYVDRAAGARPAAPHRIPVSSFERGMGQSGGLR